MARRILLANLLATARHILIQSSYMVTVTSVSLGIQMSCMVNIGGAEATVLVTKFYQPFPKI